MAAWGNEEIRALVGICIYVRRPTSTRWSQPHQIKLTYMYQEIARLHNEYGYTKSEKDMGELYSLSVNIKFLLCTRPMPDRYGLMRLDVV